MARTSNDLPRMQNQARTRAPLTAAATLSLKFWTGLSDRRRPRQPQMMRQYDLIERVKRYNPNASEALLNRAYVYAMKAHGEQKRASGDPYFSHPLEVAAILTDLKLDNSTIAAALLHDTIEDTATTRAEIDQLFGPDIGALVDGLTKLSGSTSSPRRRSRPRTCASSCSRSPTTCACCWSSSPTACTTCVRSRTCRREPAAYRRRDDRHLRAARRPHGHARDAGGTRGPGVP